MSRNIDRTVVINDSDAAAAMNASRGRSATEHYTKIDFAPILTEDRMMLNTKKHIFSIGDRLYKIAFDVYGDSQYWYLLAWWNRKPTDFHCRPGDIIYIPMPLQEVLYLWNQGYTRRFSDQGQ